ncbi:MAG: asparaginase [Blastocatellia bacterium]
MVHSLTQDAAPLIEITRGAMVESLHRGHIAAVNSTGEIIASLGKIEIPTWYRSAAKPFQTIPIITSGTARQFNLTPKELAIITASHSGEAIHLEVVATILKKIGFDESDLLCGSHVPFDETSAAKLAAENRQPQSLHNNCSGKHSGMLAFAKFIGEPTTDYLNPEHAIQQRILRVLAQFADVPTDKIAIAVDGCSAPVFGVSILAMARSYARLVGVRHTNIEPDLTDAAEQVVTAMIEFPEIVGGSRGRLDTDLMQAARGQIVSKVGAEGMQLLGVKPNAKFPTGLGIAIKIEDGDIRRARDQVVIETLRQLGLLDETQLDQLAAYRQNTIFNHRQIKVGEIHACFKL